MRYKSTPRTILSLAVALLALPFGALAQEEYASVRNLEGAAQVVGAADTQPQELTINTPLMEGDTFWTARSGRLDMFLADGNHLWLDYDSRLEVNQLPSLDPSRRRALQARLWKGAALLDLQADPVGAAAYTIVTPSATVTSLDRGLYLIEVENVDRTRVTALAGRCEVTSSGQTVQLDPMQMTYSEYGYTPTPPRPSGSMPAATLLAFRDANLPRPVRSGGDSRRYLPESLSAYSADFDGYGTWSYAGSYGYVWRPSPGYLSAGWAPYRNGRWCYRPWGVTWVPFEPWGWCHSHFGRWIFTIGFGWGWVPGYVFSPAWVNWYWGDGWLGWAPWGWDNWGHHGWCSVNINNIYVNNVTNVIVNHNGPPPVPPIARSGPLPAQKPPVGVGKQDGDPGAHPRGGSGRVDGIHLSPRDLAEYRGGRLDLAGLRQRLDRPSDTTTRPGVGTGRPDSPDGTGQRALPLSRPDAPGSGSASPDTGMGKRGGAADASTPRSLPGTRPSYEPPASRPAATPKTEPSPRSRPDSRPSYEPPTSRPAPTPRSEPSPRSQPDSRPSYEPPVSRPSPTPRTEPSPRSQPDTRPSYEPPTSRPEPRPAPQYQPPTPAPRDEAPRYEAPRTVPSRVEPKPAPAPSPSPAPSTPPSSGSAGDHKNPHSRSARNG